MQKKYSFVDIQDLTLESCQVDLNEGEHQDFEICQFSLTDFVLFGEMFLFEGFFKTNGSEMTKNSWRLGYVVYVQ